MFHYLTGASDWGSEGVPNYLEENLVDPDPYIIFSLNQMFPTESIVSEELYNNNSYRNINIKSTDPNFRGAEVKVTFLNVMTGKLDTLGYTIFHLVDGFDDQPTIVDQETGLRRAITRQDIMDDDNAEVPFNVMHRVILFPVCNRINKFSYLPRGGTVKLKPIMPEFAYQGNVESGLFANNVGIGFFTMPEGWDNSLKIIRDDPLAMESILYSDDFLNMYDQYDPNSGFVRQNFILYNEKRSNDNKLCMIAAFNDDDVINGDRDFSDVEIKITISPSTCVDHTRYTLFQEIEKHDYTSFIFDNYGFYICLNNTDYYHFSQFYKIVFEHVITSSNAHFNEDLYNIFSNVYYDDSSSEVQKIDDTSFSITTHVNPLSVPYDSKTIHVFRMDENTIQPYHDDSSEDNDENLFSTYAIARDNTIVESINVYTDGILYTTLTNNGLNRVDLTYYSEVIEI